MDINLRLNWCKVLNKHINNWRIKTIQFRIIKNLHSNLLETKLFQTNINIWFGWINWTIWLFYSIANSKQLHRMNVLNGMASNARPNIVPNNVQPNIVPNNVNNNFIYAMWFEKMMFLWENKTNKIQVGEMVFA